MISTRTQPVLRRRYGREKDQFGELHVSRADPERGMLVLVHGGFWRRRRDLHMLRPAAEALSLRGWNVWNIEYRRGDDVPWRSTLADAERAIEHVGTLTDELSVDVSTTVVVGHSAGGQLAAWACGTPAARWVHGLTTLNGVIDLGLAHRLDIGDGAVAQFTGDDVGAIAQIDPARRLPLPVPVRCLHSADDERVPMALAESFCSAARAHGSDVELVATSGTHTAPIEPGTPAWHETVDAIERPWAPSARDAR